MDAPKIFDRLGMTKPKYSAFDLSREQKLTFKMGQLIPTYLEEIVPGDRFRVKTESLIRLAPLLSPVMHRINLYLHYFFVPNRLIWTEWEKFITGGKDGNENPTYPIMFLNPSTPFTAGSLPDYLGLPITFTGGVNPSASQLPFRAYNLCVKEYYRDENLVSEGFEPQFRGYSTNITSSTDPMVTIKQRSWEKDYFTSSLPFSQRGPEVTVDASVNYFDTSQVKDATTGFNADGDLEAAGGQLEASVDGPVRIENIDDINILINELRVSSALQRWLEKSARGGYRYIETILSHFGVKSSDTRLQRPEYLGGGRQPIVISEVLNTTGTQDAPQGDMTGHGISAGTTNSFSKFFEEHGYVIGIMSVMPKPAYMQGIPKHYLRRDKVDYYWPEFANLGEQEVQNQEIYANQTLSNRIATFGYQQRYAEYKYGISSVHGEFRDTLEFWTLVRKFATAPTLNKEFVELSATQSTEFAERIFAAFEEEHIIAQLYHDVKARRPMPYFSNPQLR